jgi:hypothetical protein
MNIKRIASLLRELADAIEQEEPKRPKRKNVAAPDEPVSDEAKAKAQRALRKAGVAA